MSCKEYTETLHFIERHALMAGETVQGYWFDETQAYAARWRGEDFDRIRFATLETLTLSPLPCWKHLPEEKQRQLVATLIAEIEAEAKVRRQHMGSQVLEGYAGGLPRRF